MIKSRLAIVIPTFNRADILRTSLENLLPTSDTYSIPVHVSDNCSSDNTMSTVTELMKLHPLLHYCRNAANVRDVNFHLALNLSHSDYTWLFADYTMINPSNIEELLRLLDTDDYDLVVLNGDGRVRGIPEGCYNDKNSILQDIGWHMTWISCYVYSSRVITAGNFKRYYQTPFIQMGVAFEYFAATNAIKVYWANGIRFQPTPKSKKNSWLPFQMEILLKKWTEFVLSLPPCYELETKLSCIKQHSRKSQFFGFKAMIFQRAYNFFNVKQLLKYRRYLFLGLDGYNRMVIAVLAIVPRPLLIMLIRLARKEKYSELVEYWSRVVIG